MPILLGFFICLALVNSGTSLDCETCTGFAPSCTGEMKTCEDGEDTCAVYVSDMTLDGISAKSIIKTCTYSKICTNKTQYFRYGPEVTQRTRIACCQGDSCRPAVPELPKPLNNTSPNGKQCPACFSFLFRTCKEDDVVECHGPEDHCLDLEGVITYGPLVFKAVQKGCVTKGVCADLSLKETSLYGINIRVTKAMCKEAAWKQPPPSDQPQETNPQAVASTS